MSTLRLLPAGGTRPYSLASDPADGRRIELHVTRSPGGAGHSASVGIGAANSSWLLSGSRNTTVA